MKEAPLFVLPPLAEEFLAYLAGEKRKSPLTVTSYRVDLTQFFRYLEDVYDGMPLQQVNALIIQSWLVTGLSGRLQSGNGKKEKVSPATVRHKISCLKSFFKYAVRKRAVEQSPMSKVVSPKMRPRLPVFVEEEGMQLLEQNAVAGQPVFGDDFAGATEALVIGLLYQTGIRRIELRDLTMRRVDVSNAQIKVMGKGGKERIIPLSAHLLEEIKVYNERKRQEFGDPVLLDGDAPLLLTAKGERFSEQSLYRIVRKSLARVTTIQKKSPHVLRHTFATHLVNNGADLNAVKDLLGHASLASTQVYTHNTIESLKKAYKQAHPKA